MSRPITRRRFTASAAGATTLKAAVTPRRVLREFDYSRVRVTGGPLAAQYNRLLDHFLGLDEDRLLKVYRQRAGLPAPGRDMGGWYDADGFVAGHLIGQFVSGLSRYHATTGRTDAAEKARRLVNGYAAAFEKDGNPYASPKASTTWPCYILDKYEIGLLDAAVLARSQTARELLPRVIRGALRFIPDHTYDRGPDSPKQAPYDEPYILPENLFKAHEVTGDPKFLDMARLYLLDREFFDPLAAGQNILPGKHGYSHVIALSSGAKAYEVLGAEKYLRAIKNAWNMLEQTQQYASGGWAPKETFVVPHSGELGASLASTRDHFETPCGYYAHSKLARYLIGFTGESRYADGLERALLNTVLGAIHPDDDGGYFYYSDYHDHAQKGYYKRKWPCCAGTLIQSVADYPIDLYFQTEDSLFVVLFSESEVDWQVNGVPVKVTQHTRYPESDSIELQLEPKSPVEFSLCLRIPGWLEKPARVTVNGKTYSTQMRRGFATIRRQWRRNDSVNLTLPFPMRLLPVDDRNPNTVALLRGPVLLTAVNPPEVLQARRSELLEIQPERGMAGPLQLSTASGSIQLKPFYQVEREVYSTYFRLLDH